MKLTTEREVRCARCGGRVKSGVEVDYLHAAGEFRAEYRHLQCPKKKMDRPTLRVVSDPEDWLGWRNCASCGAEWTMEKPVAGLAGWVGPCCTREAA